MLHFVRYPPSIKPSIHASISESHTTDHTGIPRKTYQFLMQTTLLGCDSDWGGQYGSVRKTCSISSGEVLPWLRVEGFEVQGLGFRV